MREPKISTSTLSSEITKKVEVAALNFSEEAKKKIEDAKGKTLSIQEVLKRNPEGKNVRILG